MALPRLINRRNGTRSLSTPLPNRTSSTRLFFGAGICAIVLGWIVAMPFTWTVLGIFATLFLLFSVPILLRWHHSLLILTLNANAVVFVLPGAPPAWMLMAAISLAISLAAAPLSTRERYLFVPSLFRPIGFLLATILLTTFFKGGLSVSALGGASGGKRTFYLLAAIVAFLALVARPIPLQKAYSHATAFFMGGASPIIGNLLPLVNPAFYVLFAIFPPEQSGFEALGLIEATSITRFGGFATAGAAIFCTLLACYGIRGIFTFSETPSVLPFRFRGGVGVNQPWRLLLFFGVLFFSLLGGFRSVIVIMGMTFAVQFFYENLFRSRLFPGLLLFALVAGAIVVPYANRLPLSMQRTLSFLPLEIDPVARSSAQASTEWRLEMWRRLLTQEVPQHLLVGKGYLLNTHDLQILSEAQSRGQADSMEVAMLAGDYHNGPLSLLIPFGVSGVIGFLWLIIAGCNVLRRNYLYGPVALVNLNRFLLCYFIARTIYFFVFFGSFFSDLVFFLGILGLSVSINGGVRSQSAPVVDRNPVPAQ